MTSEIFSEIGTNRSKIGAKLEQNRSKINKKTSAEIVSGPSILIKMAQFVLYVISGIFTTKLPLGFGLFVFFVSFYGVLKLSKRCFLSFLNLLSKIWFRSKYRNTSYNILHSLIIWVIQFSFS